MDTKDLAHNMGVTEFSNKCGIPASTLRDWNKRDVTTNVGQIGPNGHWLYSNYDVLKVKMASVLFGEGTNWRTALFAGSKMGDQLIGRSLQPDEPFYQNAHFAFSGWDSSEIINWGCGASYDEAVSNARKPDPYHNMSITGPTALVINVDDILAHIGSGMNPLINSMGE